MTAFSRDMTSPEASSRPAVHKRKMNLTKVSEGGPESVSCASCLTVSLTVTCVLNE